MCGTCLKLILGIFILFQMRILFSQEMPVDSTRTVTAGQPEKDTLGEIPIKYRRTWEMLQQVPIDSFFFRQQNTRLGKGLYQMLIKQNTDSMVRLKTPVSNSDLASKDGKIIRKIEFRNQDIFAPVVGDTSYISSSGITKTLNTMHRDTRRQILSHHMLLQEGEPLDVFLVAENERILRELPFINEARFLVRTVPENPDSIDLVLVTQDLFPVGFNAEIGSSNTGNVSIWNRNVFGYGLQPVLTLYWAGDHKPFIGFGFSLGTSNLARSFAEARLEYINRWNQNSILLDVSRDFKSTSFLYAGGAFIEHTSMLKDIDLLDTVLTGVNLVYNNLELWAGRMIRLKNHTAQMSRGFYFTGRVNHYEKIEGPETDENYLHPYQDRALYIGSFGLSVRGYRKDNMIYTFGRTEDVPFGQKLELSAGLERGHYDIRYYLSGSASVGRYFSRTGYFYAFAQYSTYLNHGEPEQGALRFRIQYYTPLYHYNRYQYRHFIVLNYLNGVNRFEGEFVTLQNNDGIHGLRSSALRGIDKLSLNYESVLFSPLKLLGFRFAFYGLIDLGLVSPDHELFRQPRFYSGLGAGVRIRNEQLVFNTLEISLSLYPGMPADARGEYIRIGSLTRIHLQDFFPHKPEIPDYR